MANAVECPLSAGYDSMIDCGVPFTAFAHDPKRKEKQRKEKQSAREDGGLLKLVALDVRLGRIGAEATLGWAVGGGLTRELGLPSRATLMTIKAGQHIAISCARSAGRSRRRYGDLLELPW